MVTHFTTQHIYTLPRSHARTILVTPTRQFHKLRHLVTIAPQMIIYYIQNYSDGITLLVRRFAHGKRHLAAPEQQSNEAFVRMFVFICGSHPAF